MKQRDLLVFELQKYIFGETSLTEFQDWFVPFTWSPPKSVAILSNTIDHRLSEHTSGLSTERELKEFLRNELEQQSI